MSDNTDLLSEEVRAAFAGDELHVPLATIQHVARRHRRNRMLAITGTCVAATVVIGAGAFTALHVASEAARRTADERAAAQRAADEQRTAFDRGCASDWASAGFDGLRSEHSLTSLPPLVLDLKEGTPGARVYGNDSVYLLCLRLSGQIYISSAGSDVGSPDPGGVFGYESGPLPEGLSYVVGRIPPGTSRVDLGLPSGAVVPAKLGNGFFGVFDPQGSSFRDATITVVTSAGTRADRPLPAPGGGSAGNCPGEIAAMLSTAPDLTAQQRAAQLTVLPADPTTLPVYVADEALVTCGAGAVRAWFPAVPFSEQTDELSLVLYAAALRHGLAYGHAPADTQTVEVVLTDGSHVPATLMDGFYYASWPSTTLLQRVVAETPTMTYTHENGHTTTQPR